MKYRVRNKGFAVISGLLIITVGVFIALRVRTLINNSPAVRTYFNKSATVRAVWDWSSVTKRDQDQLKVDAHQLKLRQINTTFIDISGVTDANSKDFSTKLQQYIQIMQGEGINVFASAGDTDWSKPTERAIPQKLQEFAYSYTEAHPQYPLRGLEFDIESYNQKGFAAADFTTKDIVLSEYLDMVHQLVENQKSHIQSTPTLRDFSLGFSIPYWYDNENGNIRSITWQNKTGPTLYHLLDQLQQLPTSNVVVMAYRNAASGNDGSVAHSRTEVAYAQAKAPNVKVIIGQETTNVEPAKITFYGQTMVDLSQQMNSVSSEFSANSVFGGFAINDMPGLLALKNPDY